MSFVKRVAYFLIYLMVGVSLVHATTVSPSSYDWSSTLDVKQSNVLGLTSLVRFNRYVLGGELTPSNPFYFIKPLQENVQLALTFDQKAKNELRMQVAGERLDEMQKLATSNNTRAITSAANAYRQAMTAVSDNIKSLDEQKLSQVEEETAKHNVILEQVRVQVPDQAEGAINNALEASWRGTDTIADLKDRPAVPSDLVSRLQSLKSQGLLTPEEVNKLVSVKSRVEARDEVGKYVNEGVVSQSDFLRLDETAKSLYPDEFYKVHETLRFQEMQKLEDQKPDDVTLNKIQSFAKTYKPGDQIPAELRKYWVPVVRLEEIQNTLRPDLIDASLFKQNDQEAKKFNEVVERFKPRPEDIALVNNFITKNKADVNNLPPEYQRMYTLGQRYGAACGAGFNWVPESQSPAGGYCTPNGSDLSGGPKYDDFTKGKICNGNIVSAKNSDGACSAYSSNCIPPGWSRTDTCSATPVTTGSRVSCPSNSHFVSVSYDPNGGYCIPNYTQIGFNQSTGESNSVCPASTHRSYTGGPCVPDYNTSTFNNPYSLPILTTTPGGPYYTNSGRCGPNSNWVPEPINPQGGYCASNPGTSDGNPYQPKPGDYSGPSRESQEAACRSGGGVCVSWNNGACGCEHGGSTGGSGTTPSYGTPTREAQEAACRSGGGVCVSWNNGACGCEHSGSGPGGTYSPPPAGYGSCGSGLYWNGSSCQSSSYSPPPSSEPTAPTYSPPPASSPPQESAPPPQTAPPPPQESAPPAPPTN